MRRLRGWCGENGRDRRTPAGDAPRGETKGYRDAPPAPGDTGFGVQHRGRSPPPPRGGRGAASTEQSLVGARKGVGTPFFPAVGVSPRVPRGCCPPWGTCGCREGRGGRAAVAFWGHPGDTFPGVLTPEWGPHTGSWVLPAPPNVCRWDTVGKPALQARCPARFDHQFLATGETGVTGKSFLAAVPLAPPLIPEDARGLGKLLLAPQEAGGHPGSIFRLPFQGGFCFCKSPAPGVRGL